MKNSLSYKIVAGNISLTNQQHRTRSSATQQNVEETTVLLQVRTQQKVRFEENVHEVITCLLVDRTWRHHRPVLGYTRILTPATKIMVRTAY